MEQIEFPSKVSWEQRKQWFESQLEEAQNPLASYFVSDQATALLLEMQSCYCSGAWIAVIIISVSIIDAQLRETEALDTKIGTAMLLKNFYTGKDIDWLRKLRNSYVHININAPALTVDDQYQNREKMEADAKKAIEMVIHSLFQSPGT